MPRTRLALKHTARGCDSRASLADVYLNNKALTVN